MFFFMLVQFYIDFGPKKALFLHKAALFSLYMMQQLKMSQPTQSIEYQQFKLNHRFCFNNCVTKVWQIKLIVLLLQQAYIPLFLNPLWIVCCKCDK